MTFTSADFVAFLKRIKGKAVYCYGCCLQPFTQSLYSSKAKQYPTHYTSSRAAKYKQWVAEKRFAVDCVNTFEGYIWTNGGQGVLDGKTYSFKYQSNGLKDYNADGLFSYSKSLGLKWGTIGSIPEVAGIAVRYNGHVGYYIGNGKVIEARGFNYGVVETNLKDRPWTHWYYLPILTYKEDSKPAPTTKKVVITGDSVYVRESAATNGKIVSIAKKGEAYDYLGTAANGWYQINYKGVKAYITNKYTTIK